MLSSAVMSGTSSDEVLSTHRRVGGSYDVAC